MTKYKVLERQNKNNNSYFLFFFHPNKPKIITTPANKIAEKDAPIEIASWPIGPAIILMMIATMAMKISVEIKALLKNSFII